jgi:hypothetical protein
MSAPNATHAAGIFLRDPALYSAHVIGMPLHDYQLAPLRAVAESVLYERGLEYLLVMPRQSGKNETVAHLITYLLTMLQRVPGNIVFAAISDQLGRGVKRLEDRLDNLWLRGFWTRSANPTRRAVGSAGCVFLSSHPQSYSRGETAHFLLVVDELQDNDHSHIQAVLEPMRAANNATALYIGTVRFTHDALWLKKRELEALQAQDGVQRVYLVYPPDVTRANPAYSLFLRGQEAKFGREHPTIQSEYYLQPVDATGGLFPPRRVALMRGSHPRLNAPSPDEAYIATLDVAGQDEAATAYAAGAIARLANPGRDYTVATIFRVIPPETPAPGPTYEAVDVFVDHGSRHFQESPGLSGATPALVHRLLAWLQHWQVSHVIADATGAGEGLVDWLAAALGQSRITPFKFTALSKAALGSRFISIVETARFKYFTELAPESCTLDPDPLPSADPRSLIPVPLSDSWWFFTQVAACTYELLPDAPFDRGLRWRVPDAATVSTPAGLQPIHDDRLLSAALVAVYDQAVVRPLAREGALPLGRAASALIPPADPLFRLRF